jgi:SAM-dependent methyltransferase
VDNLQQVINKWESYYAGLKENYLFPNEYVIRSFLGNYPALKMNRDYQNKNLCDISCGDGRNMVLFNKLKFNLYGTEVSDQICQITQKKLLAHPDRIHADIQKGFHWDLPFIDDFFDYALSWNALYYMADQNSLIESHIKEYARILKKDAYLICSVPTPNCFSLANATQLGNNLIKLNPEFNWGDNNVLKDTIYYQFDSFEHIEKIFSPYFYNFQKCKTVADCYGLSLEYFIFVCQKK